jgi:hypothetical protein
MAEPARPTRRCVGEDLHEGWEGGAPPADLSTVPLHELSHPLIAKAAQQFPGGDADSDVRRESISGLSDPLWYKVKIQRWRGAVYEDPETGQAWLCAGGIRRAGDADDFYVAFLADVRANGPAKYLPTEDDFAHARLEAARHARREWERAIFYAVLTGVAAAARVSGESVEVPLPALAPGRSSPATLRLRVDRLTDELDPLSAHEDPAEVLVGIAVDDWSDPSLVGLLMTTACAAVSSVHEDWDVVPQAGVSEAVATITEARLGQIIAAADLPVSSFAAPVGAPGPPTHAHYAQKAQIFEGHVYGTAVVALCGVCFVPTQVPDGLPVCEACHEAMGAIRSGKPMETDTA